MEELNFLEKSLLERVTTKYPFVASHISLLKVSNREYTGVGMYVNFSYAQSPANLLNPQSASLSTNEIIKIPSLKNGLGYEVDISDGKIKFIEFITYGDEEWDGSVIGWSW